MEPILLSIFFLFGVYTAVFIAIYFLRGALWWAASFFFLIDELMWFLYNPLRGLMHNLHKKKGGYTWYFLLSFFLIKPIYQIAIYILTFPLRLITALYFDVLMYLFISLSDSLDELFHPKLKKMRHKKGLSYLFWWIILFPYRLCWVIFGNIFAFIDSVLMFFVSAAWPTFTMYHGTSQEAIFDITKKNRWYVGSGNYGGSGIYFARSIKAAQHYATSFSHKGKATKALIISRVTLSLLRNCGTLRQSEKQLVGQMNRGGSELAQKVKWPYAATELWRDGKNWWEYCLLQGGKDGQLISSWRIRAVGYVFTKDGSNFRGALQRLWGGKGLYCMSLVNIFMGIISFGITSYLGVVFVSIVNTF